MEKKESDHRGLLWIIIFIVTVGSLLIALVVMPYLAVENAARDIKQNHVFYGKSLDYVRGFLDGVEYFRWYMNNRVANATSGGNWV